MINIYFNRPIAIFAVQKLALIDYDIATKVSHDVAEISTWAYNHDLPIVAKYAVSSLQQLDYIGSLLISVVA